MADPVVKLKNGSIRGLVKNHEDGFNYYAFMSIPYAEPPIGNLRFRDPVPKTPWAGTLDCKNYCSIAFQHDIFSDSKYYAEDVLYLNVFSHSIDRQNANTPVMVNMHLGEYNFGTANDNYCGADYLIRKNIVLVTLNFRLGVLGFLDLEDEVAPGNQGLKDIVMALRWIQENIAAFGGDRNNVTIFGSSAGAATVHYLALSPLTKGLMHKVIGQNCNAYAPWIAIKNPRSHGIKFCSILGKDCEDSQEIVEFLRTIDTKTLLEAQIELRKAVKNISMPFGPGVDSKSANPLIPTHRYLMADKGFHLPYLTGISPQTGMMALLDKLTFTSATRDELFKSADVNFEQFLIFNLTDTMERYNLSVEQLRRLYYKSERVSTKNLDKFVEMMTDLLFMEAIDRVVKIQAERSSAPTYYYHFNYQTPNSLHKFLLKDVPDGTTHIDELPYLMKMDGTLKLGHKHVEKGTDEYKMMERMTEMWTNFATYGRPTIETSELIPVMWKPVVDGTLLRYLNIDEDLTMQYCVNTEEKWLSAKDIKV